MNLRIVDANLNRLREGLRVLEEVARFLIEDRRLTEELKALRHRVSDVTTPLIGQLLDARSAMADIGASGQEVLEASRPDLLSLVTANSRRVEESLRVLEEFGKLPDEETTLDWTEFKRMRFVLYDLERRLVSAVQRKDKRSKVAGLYVIVDPELSRGRSVVEVAHRALMGGAKMIQLRDKRGGARQLLGEAEELKKVCAEFEALFIVNDHPELAVASGADGLHVGQEDIPVPLARAMLDINQLVGCSTALLEEAYLAAEEGADYIAVGTIFPTKSKAETRPAGLGTLRRVKASVSLPVVAIGGINERNVDEVIEAGADAVAVISAVVSAEDVEGAARRLALKIEEAKRS